MLSAPNSRLLLLLAITAAMAAFAATVACSDASSQYIESLKTNSYLVATVDPCTPLPESDADPCKRRLDLWTGVQTPYNTGHPHKREQGPNAVKTSVTLAYDYSYSIPHVVVRGTVLPGSTRCEGPNTILFGSFFREPEVQESSRDTCFSDLRVNEYIIGSGPSMLTISVGSHHKIFDYGDPNGDRYYEWVEGIHSVYEGSEWVVALSVPIDFAYAVWRTWTSSWWDVQRRHDGIVVVVDYQARYHSQLPREENGYEVTLDEFRETARRLHADYLLANGGRIGDFDGAPRVLNDANYEFLHAHMSRSPVFDIVDATPRAAPPPPS